MDPGKCPNGCGDLAIWGDRLYCIECGATPGFVIRAGKKSGKSFEQKAAGSWMGLEEEYFFKPEDVMRHLLDMGSPVMETPDDEK